MFVVIPKRALVSTESDFRRKLTFFSRFGNASHIYTMPVRELIWHSSVFVPDLCVGSCFGGVSLLGILRNSEENVTFAPTASPCCCSDI